MSSRPNILFLMTDQQRFDLTGFAGNDLVCTPNLDRLAADAVIFDNAYTPSPVCIPARQCMAAGQLPFTCGVRHYGEDLPPNTMTFPRRLSQYGYETVVCGKLHHEGEDQSQGWTNRIGWDSGIHPKYITGRSDEAFGEIPRSPSQWWPYVKEVKRAGIGKNPHALIDQYACDGARLWIDERYLSTYYDKANFSRPRLFKVSLRVPHYPYLTDEAKFEYYLNRVPPFIEESGSDLEVLNRGPVRVGEDVDEREIRRATAAYYGMMEQADEMFGQVIDRLEFVGQDLDDWIIIFTSDHGDMLGQHGNFMKATFYEGAVRVPLFIRYPKRFTPKRVSKNMNLCDLFPTLCELTDVPLPEDHQLDGRSLVSLLEQGDAAEWDNQTISQLGETMMIKRDDLKYLCDPQSGEVLFDLAADPGELTNVISDSKYADAIARFRRQVEAMGYPAS